MPLANWEYVFVYGTLRRGQSNDINRLQPAPQWIGPAAVPGVLYSLGNYPGMLLGGHSLVQGEVYGVAPQVVDQLDVIEEIAPVPSGEYVRATVSINIDGKNYDCLVYEISPERVRGLTPIWGGDWVRRA